MARWKILLREYDYDITHKPGKINMNADALSRNPIPIAPINLSDLSMQELSPEVNIERIFIINKPKSREHNSKLAEDSEISYVLTSINNELTNAYRFRPASSIEETAVVGNTTKVSFSVKSVRNGVDVDNLKEVNSVRRVDI